MRLHCNKIVFVFIPIVLGSVLENLLRFGLFAFPLEFLIAAKGFNPSNVV